MSLSPIRDLGPAPLQRTITPSGAQVVLCDATNTPIAANPQGVNHPPSQVLVIPDADGSTLAWLDLAGTSNTITIPSGAISPFYLPGTIKSIEAASTGGVIVVVSWHPEP